MFEQFEEHQKTSGYKVGVNKAEGLVSIQFELEDGSATHHFSFPANAAYLLVDSVMRAGIDVLAEHFGDMVMAQEFYKKSLAHGMEKSTSGNVDPGSPVEVRAYPICGTQTGSSVAGKPIALFRFYLAKGGSELSPWYCCSIAGLDKVIRAMDEEKKKLLKGKLMSGAFEENPN